MTHSSFSISHANTWRLAPLMAALMIALAPFPIHAQTTSLQNSAVGNIETDGSTNTYQFSGSTGTVDIGNGSKAIINWSALGLQASETLNFNSNQAAIFLNKVTGGASSLINGQVTAAMPGSTLIFINPNGIEIGSDFSLSTNINNFLLSTQSSYLASVGSFSTLTDIQNSFTDTGSGILKINSDSAGLGNFNGNLYLYSAGLLQVVGSAPLSMNAIVVSADDEVNLTTAVNQAEISSLNNQNITLSNSGSLVLNKINAGTGDVEISATGALTQGSGAITANLLTLKSDGQIGTTSVPLVTNIHSLKVGGKQQNATNHHIYIQESDGIEVSSVNAGAGDFELQTPGNITSSGTISAKNIILKSTGGNLSLTTVNANDEIRLEALGALQAGNLQADAIQLKASKIGVSAEQRVQVNAALELDIHTTGKGQQDAGAVYLLSDAGLTQLSDQSFLAENQPPTLGDAKSTLTLEGAVADSQKVDIQYTSAAGTVTLNGVDLTDNSSNGQALKVQLVLQAASDLAIEGSNRMTADVTLQAGDEIYGTGVLQGADNGTLHLKAKDIDQLADSANGYQSTTPLMVSSGNLGQLQLTTSGSADIQSPGALILGESQVGGDLSLQSAGNMVGQGSLKVQGHTALSATGQTISFTQSNDLNTLSVTAAQASIVDQNALVLSDSSLSGDYQVTTGGDLTDSGMVVANGLSFRTQGKVALDQLQIASLNHSWATDSVVVHNQHQNLTVNNLVIFSNQTQNKTVSLESSGDIELKGVITGGKDITGHTLNDAQSIRFDQSLSAADFADNSLSYLKNIQITASGDITTPNQVDAGLLKAEGFALTADQGIGAQPNVSPGTQQGIKLDWEADHATDTDNLIFTFTNRNIGAEERLAATLVGSGSSTFALQDYIDGRLQFQFPNDANPSVRAQKPLGGYLSGSQLRLIQAGEVADFDLSLTTPAERIQYITGIETGKENAQIPTEPSQIISGEIETTAIEIPQENVVGKSVTLIELVSNNHSTDMNLTDQSNTVLDITEPTQPQQNRGEAVTESILSTEPQTSQTTIQVVEASAYTENTTSLETATTTQESEVGTQKDTVIKAETHLEKINTEQVVEMVEATTESTTNTSLEGDIDTVSTTKIDKTKISEQTHPESPSGSSRTTDELLEELDGETRGTGGQETSKKHVTERPSLTPDIEQMGQKDNADTGLTIIESVEKLLSIEESFAEAEIDVTTDATLEPEQEKAPSEVVAEEVENSLDAETSEPPSQSQVDTEVTLTSSAAVDNQVAMEDEEVIGEAYANALVEASASDTATLLGYMQKILNE